MGLQTKPFDIVDHLDSDEEIRLYLEAAFEDGDPMLIKSAIADVARAKGMSAIAREAGISRGGLYKALGKNGNPSLENLSAILASVGMRLSVASAA